MDNGNEIPKVEPVEKPVEKSPEELQKEKLAEKIRKREEKRKQREERKKRKAAKNKESEEKEESVVSIDEVKKLFPQIPQSPELAQVVNELNQASVAKGGASSDLLVKYYLKLRKTAQEQGIGLEFLSDLRGELAERKVNVEALAEQRDNLREKWYQEFTEKELANQDTKSTIEIAVELGYEPAEVTSVGQKEVKAKEVISNALLDDEARKAKAQEKLGRPLTEEQEKLILDIHNVGKGEAGKNGSPASVYNYSVGQLLRKRRLLKVLEKTGVTEDEVRSLVEAGIAGETIPVDPSITDSSLKTQLEMLNKTLTVTNDQDLSGQVEAMDKAIDRISSMPGVNQAQRDALLNQIIDQQTDLQTSGGQSRRREYAHEFVKKREGQTQGDLNIVIANFSADDGTKGIATRVIEGVDQGRADNDFLKENIDELYEIQQELEARQVRERNGPEVGRIAQALDETLKLRGMLQSAKNLITAREVEANMRSGVSQSLYGEIRLTSDEKERLAESILNGHEWEVDEKFNELFYTADTKSGDDWREAQGQAASLEVEDFARALGLYASGRMTFRKRSLTSQEKDKLDKVGRRLSAEVKLRQNLHDVNYYVNKNFGIEEILKVIKTFSVEDADMAYGIKGVPEVGHFFEQAMYEVMLRHGGHLPSEAMMNKNGGGTGEVEELVREHIKQAIEIGALDWDIDKDRWEINRAVSIARGMGIVTGRTIEIVAGAGIPPEAGGGVLVGWWANNIIKKIAFFRQISRYDVGKEANRFMAYKLENTSRFWHTKELSGISGLSDHKLINNWFNESDDDRWSDMLNPGQVGSIFYQTGWRYGEDKVNHAGAIVRLLADNPFNPIIGAGMWVEKQRRQLNNTDEISASERLELRNQFGIDLGPNGTKGDKAALIISKNLDLAAQITPLKLFHNLVGLKQQVLRTYYLGSISEPAGEEGRITITDEVLKGDLETLAVIQEKLVKKRTDSYKNYLKEKEANPGSGLRPPDLYNVDADINIEIDQLIAGNKLDAGKGGRIKAFVKHVNDEFTASTGGNLSQKDKLISNLKDKGWKIPFIFGTDDLPYDLFNFAATGSNGFERRWGDINSVAQAASLFEKLIRDIPNIPDQDTLIGKMNEIYDAMAGHDEGRTREFMVRFAEGIVKFYKKDIVKRIPAGFGMFDGMVNGEASFAQIAYGRKQMAWNELDVRRFVNEVQFHGLVEKGALDELRKKTGAEGWIMGLAIARSGIPLGLLGFFYYMFTAEMEGLVKAA